MAPTGVDRPVRSVLILDVDHFKSINDEHGHVIGDRILADMSRRVRQTAPPTAIAVRIGGEEIAVLLEVGRDEAVTLAGRLHAAVRERPYEGGIAVTASVAAATGGPEIDGQELLREADTAVYAAKAAGRDCGRHAAEVREEALSHDIDPDVQGFENLTRVIAERDAEVLSSRSRRLFEQRQEQADRDAVTGLYSRRYLDRRLAFEVEHHSDEGPLSMTLFDIDFFGKVNKTHGWSVGDAVLAGVSRRIVEGTRGTDWTARYGGEELLVVLKDTPVDRATVVIDRIRASIAAKPFAGPEGIDVTITVSVGSPSSPRARGWSRSRPG